jgi:hypothetical protein
MTMTSKPKARKIPIRLIDRSGWCCEIKEERWRNYAKAMTNGDEFPPVSVIRKDGSTNGGYPYELSDGFHRTRAAEYLGRRTIAAQVIADERRRAWFSLPSSTFDD